MLDSVNDRTAINCPVWCWTNLEKCVWVSIGELLATAAALTDKREERGIVFKRLGIIHILE